MISEIDLMDLETERVFTDALHNSIHSLDQLDVTDVDFYIERKGLPGPPAL